MKRWLLKEPRWAATSFLRQSELGEILQARKPESSRRVVQIRDGFIGLACGVHADGAASCVDACRSMPKDVDRFRPPADVTLTLVRVVQETVCGLDLDGRPVCWGRSGPTTREAPDERFIDLSLDSFCACGIHQDGTVTSRSSPARSR